MLGRIDPESPVGISGFGLAHHVRIEDTSRTTPTSCGPWVLTLRVPFDGPVTEPRKVRVQRFDT